MAITWNESLSNELKQLKASKNLTPQQKKKIATLQGIKSASGGVVKGQKPAPKLSDAANANDGTINPDKAQEVIGGSEKQDVTDNFNLSQPMLQTDQFGNTQTVTRNPDGTVTVTQGAGGLSKKFSSLAEAAASTFNGDKDRAAAEDASYGTLTKYYDRDKSREMEDSKQELANRGIPYDPAAANDPNTKNLYGKTIGAIDQKYQGLKDTAAQQSVISGNQAYATSGSVRDSFINAVTNGASTFSGKFGPYQNTVQTDASGDNKDILSMSAQQYANKMGITIQAAIEQKKIALANRSSGGSGTPKAASTGGGFEIVG